MTKQIHTIIISDGARAPHQKIHTRATTINYTSPASLTRLWLYTISKSLGHTLCVLADARL